MADDPQPLDYRTPPPPRGPFRWGDFAAGFFSAFMICAGLFGGLVAAVSEFDGSTTSPIVKALPLVVAVAGIVALFVWAGRVRRSTRPPGMATGLYVGLGLALLALGPCVGCYAIFVVGG